MRPSARRPTLLSQAQQNRERARRIGAGGVLAALIAAEAAAHSEPPATAEPAEEAPVASSLEDILAFAQVCAPRPSFGAFAAAHDHGPFTPHFRSARLERDSRDECGGASAFGPTDSPEAHAGHAVASSEGASSSGHASRGAHGRVAASEGDMPAGLHADHAMTPAVAVPHLQHSLDAGLDALLAHLAAPSAHSEHAGLSEIDEVQQAASPSEGGEPVDDAILAATSVQSSHVGHAMTSEAPAEALIVTVEI